MRERWITIGRVERKFVVLGNCGFPEGLSIRWAGRVDWCQPCEFLTWDQLIRACAWRLVLKNMQAINWSCLIPATRHAQEFELRVLVRPLWPKKPIGEVK